MTDYAAEVAAAKARREAKAQAILVEAAKELAEWAQRHHEVQPQQKKPTVVTKQRCVVCGLNAKKFGYCGSCLAKAKKDPATRKIILTKLRKERYRKTHRATLRAKDRTRSTTARKRQKDREWAKQHPERMKELQANWRKKHRHTIRQRDKDYYRRTHGLSTETSPTSE